MTELSIEERLENLEKVFVDYVITTEEKLEILRENNNLFSNEIKKLGGFQDD